SFLSLCFPLPHPPFPRLSVCLLVETSVFLSLSFLFFSLFLRLLFLSFFLSPSFPSLSLFLCLRGFPSFTHSFRPSLILSFSLSFFLSFFSAFLFVCRVSSSECVEVSPSVRQDVALLGI
ncbi:hypothetical protein CSUI_010502, partial [Cystoisospora suis]